MIEYSNTVIFVILLIFSAFFSASEVALVGINRAKVRVLSEEGGAAGKRLEKLKNNLDHFLITILIGNKTLLLLIFGEIGPKTFTTAELRQWRCLL